jgi:hypothetical protein
MVAAYDILLKDDEMEWIEKREVVHTQQVLFDSVRFCYPYRCVFSGSLLFIENTSPILEAGISYQGVTVIWAPSAQQERNRSSGW